MLGRKVVLATLSLGLAVVALAGGTPAGAVPPAPVHDGNGKQFRQLYETTGVSWNQVAEICPRDGETPCSGAIGAKGSRVGSGERMPQVVDLLGSYEPAILTADPPAVSGPEQFLLAAGFLGEMRWTGSTASTYSRARNGRTDGRRPPTAGQPVGGAVAMGYPSPCGSFAVRAGRDRRRGRPTRGVWLWRPSGTNHRRPSITPIVNGTKGNAGWYVSDVSVDMGRR